MTASKKTLKQTIAKTGTRPNKMLSRLSPSGAGKNTPLLSMQNKMIEYLQMQSKVIECLAPKITASWSEKDIHKLRVAMRRARSVLWVVRHSSVKIRFKKLNGELHRLGKSLGRVRELDVAIRDAKHYDLTSLRLKARRKSLQKKLKKLINRDQINSLLIKLSSLEKAVYAAPPGSLKEARDDLCVELNQQLQRHVHKQKKLHHLRLVLKKARYVIESIGRPTDPIKNLQDILGEAHDLEILQTLIGKNKKIEAERHLLNEKGIRLVNPALRFAIIQLGRR